MSNLVPVVKRLDREPVELVEIITPKCANTYGQGFCAAAAGVGGECFDTRATCQDTANYQARPLSHLTPDRIFNQGDTGTTDFNGDAAYIIEVDLFIPIDPDGCVFEVGGTGTGVYIGFTASELVMRAGSGSSTTATGTARLAVDAAPYEGKTLTLIAVLEHDVGTDCTVTGYYFDPIELELTKIGTVTSSTDPSDLFGTNDYGVGEIGGGATPLGEGGEDYNGTISSVRMYDYEFGLVGANIVENGSFDTDVSEWLPFNSPNPAADSTGVFEDGRMLVTSGVATGLGMEQEVALEVGADYLLQTNSEYVAGTDGASIGLVNFARDAFIAQSTFNTTSGSETQQLVTATATEAVQVVYLRSGSNGGTGQSYFDDVTVRKFITPDELLFVDQCLSESLFPRRWPQGATQRKHLYGPSLGDTSAVGSRINIGGSDERFEPLGRRATFTFGINDAPHSDYPYDPYRSTRLYNPLARGKFWLKWLAREKFGKTRAIVRRHTGYNGQALADMRSQLYVLDRVTTGQDRLQVNCRDFLSLTEFRRTQVPAPTDGLLDADITDSATTLFLAGDVTTQYPAAGTLRINDELITYTARAYDGVDDQTDFTGLTRGTDGSTAAAHVIDDNVQNCRRYEDVTVSELLLGLLITDSRIPAQAVSVSKIMTESTQSLAAYALSTVISEPTGVDQLIGEIAESCTFYIWWNERTQKVDMQAIKPVDEVSVNLTDEGNVVGQITFEERPKERVTFVNIYSEPRNFAGDLDRPSNFKQQAIIGTASDPDKYGKLVQTREMFTRWLTSSAQVQQTGARYAIRYDDVPQYASHMVDAKDGGLWLGNFVTLSTDERLRPTGERDVRRYVIIEAEETEPGHKQRLLLSDVTLDGQTFTITEDGIGGYTAEVFEAGNAFITDDDGLNPDGTVGATIS